VTVSMFTQHYKLTRLVPLIRRALQIILRKWD
jgi:hypothetical protein